MKFKIYIGYDKREHDAYLVARQSLLNHTSIDVDIRPLKLQELRNSGLYWRNRDAKASTEFSFSRFLVPRLNGYRGWALFLDCDVLLRADVGELLALADKDKAVMVIKHDYQPQEVNKMDGMKQRIYPRKNWSSVVLWNCGHPANKYVTPQMINTKPGLYLHQFQWLKDDLIGELPEEWNWLEGWSSKNIDPKLVHMTRGGPWFEDWKHVDYADEWSKVRKGLI